MSGDTTDHADHRWSECISEFAGSRPAHRAIIIPNIYDYNHSGMSTRPGMMIPAHWRTLGAVTSEAALFWCAHEKLVVTASSLPRELAEYVQRALDYEPATLRSPHHVTGELLDDLARDQGLLDEICLFGQEAIYTHLLVWGATAGSAALLALLRTRGLAVESEDIPDQERLWTAAYLDSKVGCRELFGRIAEEVPAVIMPEGHILPSLDGAVEVIRHFYAQGKGCMIKADRGANGVGLIPMELAWSKHPDASIARYIHGRAEDVAYLVVDRPIVIEEIIPSSQPNRGSATMPGSLFMNAQVGPHGEVTIFGGGSELRNRQNIYVGAQMGKGSLLESVYSTLEHIMYRLCTVAANLGYRGHIGGDFLLDQAGRVVMLEVNARRCSESPVHELGRRLFGDGWSAHAAALVRMPRYVVLERKPSLAAIVDVFESVGAPSQAKNGVAIPLCLSWILLDTPALGFVVFGADQEVVRDTETALMSRLARLGIRPR